MEKQCFEDVLKRRRACEAVGLWKRAVVLCVGVALSMSLAAAAEVAPCNGPWIRNLAGPHAVTRPMRDVASLRQRLPDLEASIRTVVANDPSLSPGVAEALIAAIRDGSGITERPMRRDEAVRWMAYQPRPGEIAAISPACLRLERNYDAFEITVEVPEPVPVATTTAPTCAIAATRNCADANATIAVDVRGSSPGARVTLATGGRPAVAVAGQGESWTVEDPSPYDDAIFTVRAQNASLPAATARVFRFLMPKVCGNLAYLGEAERKTIAAEGAPAACERSLHVARCASTPSPELTPPPITTAVADRCDDGWVVRPFLFGFFPTGDDQQRDILLPSGPAHERFSIGEGYGIGGSLERRLGRVLGLEAAVLFGTGDAEYELDTGSVSGRVSHQPNIYALTFGPNFHLLGCGGSDLYVGPFVGYGGLADPNFRTLGHLFKATFDGRFIWGAQLGLDIPFRQDGRWGFHGGLRYFGLSQDTDAGSITVDPLIVEVGLAYSF